MKVIICGAGQVGWQIARHLSGERNDVTIVDSNPELVRRATETLDVHGSVRAIDFEPKTTKFRIKTMEGARGHHFGKLLRVSPHVCNAKYYSVVHTGIL